MAKSKSKEVTEPKEEQVTTPIKEYRPLPKFPKHCNNC
jgi:hypothetical protein